MTRPLVAYLVTAVVFLALDAAYLGTVGGKMFKATLGDVLAPNVVLTPAVLFYLIFPVGLVIFAAMPGLASGRWTTALIYGGLFGFFAYATYDLTNFATIRNWAVSITVADLCWGTILSGVSTSAGVAITRAILG